MLVSALLPSTSSHNQKHVNNFSYGLTLRLSAPFELSARGQTVLVELVSTTVNRSPHPSCLPTTHSHFLHVLSPLPALSPH